MVTKYTMIATKDGTTTVTWPSFGVPDTGGTGIHAPAGVLTSIRVLEVSRVSESWQNLDSTLMPGTAQGLWHFDGGLTDSSGNGFDLSHESASPLLFETIQGLQCIRLSGSDTEQLVRPSNDVALRLSGAMSIWIILQLTNLDTSNIARLCAFDIDVPLPDTLDYNNQYALYLTSSVGRLFWAHEHDAGVNDDFFTTTAAKFGKLSFVSASRSGIGDVDIFVDGVDYGGLTGSLPNGGTNASVRFRIGGSNVGGDLGARSIRGYYGGIAITDASHTLNEHLAMYDRVRGLV